jgi:KaiC/GvpD/RAD55 family RecA-like ATPase
MNPREIAKRYALRGWHVFPCRPDKQPLTTHGFKDAVGDPAAVDVLWDQYPAAEVIGIATGASGLIVVDIDVKGEDGMAGWRDLVAEYGAKLEDTTMVRTPSGGLHVYYRANGDGIANSASKLAPGIDVRADGGYVIAAGSPGYSWVEKHGIHQRQPQPIPKELASRLKTAQRPVAPVGEVTPEGRRNDTLTSLAGSMRRRGMLPDAILAALRVENDRCIPPLPDEEVTAIARSVGRYAPAKEPEQEKAEGPVNSRDAFKLFEADLLKRMSGEIKGLGWPDVWPGLARTVGPIEPGTLTVVAAHTSVGKTIFAMQLLRSLAAEGHRILYVTRELTVERLIRRHLCAYGADNDRLKAGTPNGDDFSAIDVYERESKDWRVEYDGRSMTVAQIREHAERSKPAVVFIDYLQGLGYDAAQEYGSVTNIVNQIQTFALETNIPVVLVSQLRRSQPGKEHVAPHLSDTRGTGAVEERATTFILLHRKWDTDTKEEYGKPVETPKVQTNEGWFIVAKNADGESDKFIRVLYEGRQSRIREELDD